MEKLILIDGNALAYRAYYATAQSLPLLQTSNGIPTNALHSMANMMYSILSKYKPSHILVAFDAKGKTFRHKKLDTYKGKRKATPAELISQLPLIKELLTLMNIKIYEVSGFEADDIIATLAEQAGVSKKYKTLIISSDKDLYQMVNDQKNIKMFQNSTGMSRGNIINEAYIRENYDVDVSQFGYYKSLIGDASDNLSGVKGIGKKTAAMLLNQFDTLSDIYNNIDQIEKPAIVKKLIAGKEDAFFTLDLVTLVTNMELPFSIEDTSIVLNNIANNQVFNFLELYEMHSYLRKLKKIYHNQNPVIVEQENHNITTINYLDTQKPWAIYCELLNDNYHTSDFFKIIISDGTRYVIIDNEAQLLNDHLLKARLLDPKIIKYSFNWKKDYLFFKRFNINLINVKWDVSLAIYLIDSSIAQEWLAISHYLKAKIIDDKEFYNNIDNKKINDNLNYNNFLISKINLIFTSFELLNQQLVAQKLIDLYYNIELPLVLTLAKMEYTGVLTDPQIFQDIKVKTNLKLAELSTKIYQLAEVEFNINSPKQLQDILFNKLALSTFNKKKSTAKAVLQEMIPQHEIIELILAYRKSFKLLTTYIEGMTKFINDKNVINTIYLQNKTTSGRLSSKYPNMQNIVEHEEDQRNLKKAFIARENKILISFDYSQIELRLLAFLSNDQDLLDDFQAGLDIHRETAAKLFNKRSIDVTSIERHRAKTINFGLIYGQSKFALSQTLNISFKQAEIFINRYFEQFPKIKKYKEDQIQYARDHKFAITYFNRRRQLVDIDASNFQVRSAAERIAVNMPIQGTAADILKIALVKIDKIIDWKSTTMIASIHDEIIIETDKNNYEDVMKKISNIMETIDSEIKLKVSVNFGYNWYNLK